LAEKVTPNEVATDAAAVYPAALDELIPAARHHVQQYASPIEAEHGRLNHLQRRVGRERAWRARRQGRKPFSDAVVISSARWRVAGRRDRV
jgi:hypothetical protein